MKKVINPTVIIRPIITVNGNYAYIIECEEHPAGVLTYVPDIILENVFTSRGYNEVEVNSDVSAGVKKSDA